MWLVVFEIVVSKFIWFSIFEVIVFVVDCVGVRGFGVDGVSLVWIFFVVWEFVGFCFFF